MDMDMVGKDWIGYDEIGWDKKKNEWETDWVKKWFIVVVS